MRNFRRNELRVLAIDPDTQSVGFAILEGADNLIGWGARLTPKNKNARCLKLTTSLIEWYKPDLIVVEDYKDNPWRCSRVRRLAAAIRKLASKKNIRCVSLSRSRIKAAFPGTRNQHQIATAIAEKFPELAPKLPPKRKPWQNEDYRMGIFGAVALGLAFFHFLDKRGRLSCSPNAHGVV